MPFPSKNDEQKRHQKRKIIVRMKSHWIKWVRLFYALFYIYRIRCIYIFRWLSPKKKHANKPNLTLIKNKWHQVHTNTLIRAYFNFIFLVFCLFFLICVTVVTRSRFTMSLLFLLWLMERCADCGHSSSENSSTKYVSKVNFILFLFFLWSNLTEF